MIRLIWHFLFNRYDLVLTSTPKALLLASIAACFTMQRRRVAFFQGRVYENFRGLRRRIYRLFDRATVACVHEVLFVSRSLMSEFVNEMPTAETKGRVLGDGSGNGICSQTFSHDAVPLERVEEIRRELGLLASDFVILVVGRICADKGLVEIEQVADRLVDSGAKLVLVGPPEGEKAASFLKRLVASKVVRHVPFTRDVVSYFALANAHLFLSHREGFGNVAIEAAAMGVPTIAFDVVGVRDSVGDGVSGIRVDFGDVDAVAMILRGMMDDREGTLNRFVHARQWALERFSRERVWAEFAEFYRGAQPANKQSESYG
nr:glycosyltransferase [Lysobacter sp. A03]